MFSILFYILKLCIVAIDIYVYIHVYLFCYISTHTYFIAPMDYLLLFVPNDPGLSKEEENSCIECHYHWK